MTRRTLIHIPHVRYRGGENVNNAFTLNELWDALEESDALAALHSPRRISRHDRITLIFPEKFCALFENRSLSYLSWFLNNDKKALPLRKSLYGLFREDPFSFVNEMTVRWQNLLISRNAESVLSASSAAGGHTADSSADRFKKCLSALLDQYTKRIPLLSKEGSFYRRLLVLTQHEPAKALTVFAICSSMDLEKEDLDTIFSVWELIPAESGHKTDLISIGRLLYEKGDHAEALKCFRRAEKKGLLTDPELLDLTGCMLLYGDGCRSDTTAAENYFRLSAEQGCGSAMYHLAVLFRRAGRTDEALMQLENGVSAGSLRCCRALGNSWYYGNELTGGTIDREKAFRCFRSGIKEEEPAAGDHGCQFMYGKMLLKRKMRDDGVYWLETAATGGNEEAVEYLADLSAEAAFDDDSPAKLLGIDSEMSVCLSNSSSDAARIFERGLPKDTCAFHVCEDLVPPLFRALEEEDAPRIILILFDDNERKNIRDAVRIIDELKSLAHKSGNHPVEDRVHLYVRSRRQKAEALIDSTMASGPNGFYVPVSICDEDAMASDQLLLKYPLFIPLLNGADAARSAGIHLVILGDHPGIITLIRDAIASAQMDNVDFSIDVIGSDAERMGEQLRVLCPGIRALPDSVIHCVPAFITCADEKGAIINALYGEGRINSAAPFAQSARPHFAQENEDASGNLSTALLRGNYFITFYKEDAKSREMAIFLREWLLKTDPSFSRLPFIAAFCTDEREAWYSRFLSTGNDPVGNRWYNNYNIHTFGSPGMMFSAENILCSSVSNMALSLHCMLSGAAPGSGTSEERHALKSYYSRSYNRHSSRMSVLSLIYRMFSAGVYLNDWRQYSRDSMVASLGKPFEMILKKGTQSEQDARIETLARYEHDRWCRSMVMDGWLPASPGQMLSYVLRGNPRHQLYIAKLHPFLASWEALGDNLPVPNGIQKEYNLIMEQLHPGKKAPDIKEIDRAAVKMTPALLNSFATV